MIGRSSGPRHRRPGLRYAAARLGAALAVLAVLLVQPAPGAAQSPECTLADEIRATSCRLLSGEAADGRLPEGGGALTYRLDVLDQGAALDLTLAGGGAGTSLTVLDWRGTPLGKAVHGDDAPDVRLALAIPRPGVYAVRVAGDAPADAPAFRLTPTLRYPTAEPRVLWPRGRAGGASALAGERQVIRTPRGGTPEGGVAVARSLGAPPDGLVEDFTLVSDVQLDRIVGPAALTVRFRYEPEAGGGSGYLLSLNPIAGTALLESFEEGRRHPLVADARLPVELRGDAPSRLILRAAGPEITVTLDGEPVLAATDGRYPRGLVAVGVVTWSDPVTATFDHLLLTTPTR